MTLPDEKTAGDSPAAVRIDEQDDSAVPADPVLRYVRPVLAALLTFGSLAWSADLYRDAGLVLFTEQFLAGMLGVALALVFMHYPARRGAERLRVPVYDLILAAIGLGAGAYVAVVFPELSEQLDTDPLDGLIVSAIFVVLCIEGLRRSVGYSLTIIVAVCIGYSLIGHLVPGALETRQIEIRSFLTYLALDTSALLGLAMVVGTTVVITFIFFGQLLMRSGGSQFFSDISLVLMGRYRGGSAKISIIASSLFGSVSGVAVSNIVATGVVTIPMMKRSGFSPRFAGAVEAVASTGGQLMPPVMGAVAFLMADFLERPYQDIVIAALVPSLLYYVGLFIQADLEAAKSGIRRVPADLIPRTAAVLATGWVFVIPFAALIWALFTLNWEPETAAMLASGTVLLIAFYLISVGHLQRRTGGSFPDTRAVLPLAASISAPVFALVWLLFAVEVLSSLMATVLSGAAVITGFFAAGLATMAVAAGEVATPARALATFMGYLVRALTAGALPFAAPLLLAAWVGWGVNIIPSSLVLFLTLAALALAITTGSPRIRAAPDPDASAPQQEATLPTAIWGLIDLLRQSLVRAGLSSLDIIMIVAGAGFIIGTLHITGLGFALTVMLVEFGGGSLFLLLVIAALLCIVLGMGMPTAGVYILLAVLIAPSLAKVGIDPLAAHMFILYLGMMSLITPPVAVAAFFAASIAGAPAMKTGWTSVRFGWTAFVVPFLFVFSPSLLLQGRPLDLAIDVTSAVAGVWILSSAVVGYLFRETPGTMRVVMAIAGVALLLPRGIDGPIVWINAAGFGLALLVTLYELNRHRRAAAARHE